MLHVVLHLHDEAVGKLGVDRSRVDESGSGGQVLEARHLAVERQCRLVGVGLIEGQPHRDAHPEVLRHFERVAVATLDAVAVVEGHDTDVLEQLVVGGVEMGAQQVEVEELGQARVEQSLLDSPGDVGREVRVVQFLEFGGGLIVAEHALVDGLEQKAGRDHVEGGVVFHVLEGNLDDRLVKLLGGDAVEQGEFEFGGDLGDPGDVVVKSGAGGLDREVDLVGIVRLPLAAALDDCNCHETLPHLPRKGHSSPRKSATTVTPGLAVPPLYIVPPSLIQPHI